MDLLKSYDKNKKNHLVDDDNKHLLKEVTAASAVGAFTGRAGDYIDQRFAGPFHPEFAQLKDLLKKQVDSDIIKRMYTDDRTPITDQEFIEIDWKYEYDEYVKQDNSKFKSTSEDEMEVVDLEIDYDKIIDNTEKNKKYINDTNDWKSNVDYEYDDNSYLNIDKSNFINTTSETEMRFVDTIDKSKFDEPEVKLKIANITIKDEFGKVVDKTEDNKKFVEPSNGWKYIYEEKKY